MVSIECKNPLTQEGTDKTIFHEGKSNGSPIGVDDDSVNEVQRSLKLSSERRILFDPYGCYDHSTDEASKKRDVDADKKSLSTLPSPRRLFAPPKNTKSPSEAVKKEGSRSHSYSLKECVPQTLPRFPSSLRDAETDEAIEAKMIWLNEALLVPVQENAILSALSECYRDKQMVEARIHIDRVVMEEKHNLFRDFPFDLQLLEQSIQLLLDIDISWLAIAVSLVLNNETLLHSEVSKTRTSRFLKRYFFGDEKLLSRDNDRKCSTPSGTVGSLYREDLQKLICKRMIILVKLLDFAKFRSGNTTPLLFLKKSSVKSTREILRRLHGAIVLDAKEFPRCLKRMDLRLEYVQQPLEEYFHTPVTNLPGDLSDGVRLARLVEMVSDVPHGKFLDQMHTWPVSRSQRTRNIDVCLRILTKSQVLEDREISARSIEMGVRDPILRLLDRLMSMSCPIRC